LSDFQDGFEGHSPRRVTDSLDERFDDFPRFEDAVTQFLERSSEMRINLRESSTELKADHATVIVDAEMIFTDQSQARLRPAAARSIQFDFVFNPEKRLEDFRDYSPAVF